VLRFVELVSEERQATRENVERKQARAFDDEEEEDEVEEDPEEEIAQDDVPYNPKNCKLNSFQKFQYQILLVKSNKY
jgi:splicing factor 3A subunit 3